LKTNTTRTTAGTTTASRSLYSLMRRLRESPLKLDVL
jgi:hypothetical protein